MSKLYLTFMIIFFAIFIALAFLSRLLAPVNLWMRHQVDSRRDIRMRPLMVITHRYNDALSLSIQIVLISLLLGLVWRDWRRATILLAAMFIQTTVIALCKRISSIDRPPQLISPITMTSGSYPSGHSAASMTFALLVPTVLLPYLALVWVIIIAVYLACVALLTAYGRLYLDVHWLTDIVGGWSLSGAVYMLSRALIG